MKIAIVSDDNHTISQHFGRAENYIVISVEQQNIIDRKTLPKFSQCHTKGKHHGRHSHQSDSRGSGFGDQSGHKHDKMFKNITDCDVLLARGMGRGAYLGLQELGIKPIITDIADIDAAVQAILDDTIIDHTEKLH